MLYQNKNAANFWRCGFTSVGSLPMAKKKAGYFTATRPNQL
jgi:hypothetical protein